MPSVLWAAAMQTLRALAHRYRLLAMLVVLCALALKAAVPAGYMVARHGTVLTIEICADASGGTLTQRIVVPRSGAPDKAGDTQGKGPATCPYAALGFAALAGADAVLLGLALAFILALGFQPARTTPPGRIPHVLPPLRGPPALA